VIRPNSKIINFFIKSIKVHFKIKELRLIKDYLGLNIDYNPKVDYLKLYQIKYINKLFIKFGFKNIKIYNTPIDFNIKLEFNNNKTNISEIYYFQILIGFLLFLVLTNCPDIIFAIIKFARFVSNPNSDYLKVIKRIYSYLKRTITLGITYSSANQSSYLQGYCNTNYAGDLGIYKNTTGYLFILAGGLII
jgi:hypothetical protein